MFNGTKYERWYLAIVAHAASERRAKGGLLYFEKHHIVPKALGGSDCADNLVLLTPREHFICHLLLTRAVANKRHAAKMMMAFYAMRWRSRNHLGLRVNSRLFDALRRRHAAAVSLLKIGSRPKLSEEVIRNRRDTRHMNTPEARANKSASLKGKPFTPEHCLNISLGKKGRKTGPHSAEHRHKIGLPQQGVPRPSCRGEKHWCFRGAVLQLTLSGDVVEEYPDVAAVKAAGFTDTVYSVLSGHQKTHKGFVWKWKSPPMFAA